MRSFAISRAEGEYLVDLLESLSGAGANGEHHMALDIADEMRRVFGMVARVQNDSPLSAETGLSDEKKGRIMDIYNRPETRRPLGVPYDPNR